YRFQINGLLFTGELFEDFAQHVLDLRGVDFGRRDSYRYAACAEGLGLKTIACKFFGDVAEDRLLGGSQFDDQGHEQALTLHLLGGALPQDSLEEHTFVRHMLIDDPESVFIDGKNE